MCVEMVKCQLLSGMCLPCFERELFSVLFYLKNILLEKLFKLIILNWYSFTSSNEVSSSQYQNLCN